jgi:hypothetical protein
MSEEQQQATTEQAVDPAAQQQDAPLGEAGEKALKAEREARKALEREMKLLKQQLSPEARLAAEQRARELEEAAAKAQESASIKERELRAKYEADLRTAAERAEKAERDFLQYRLKMDQQRIFQAAEGLDGISSDGRSFFDMFHALKGDAFKYDENGELIVVGPDGEQLRDKETRLPISPVDYVKSLQNDPVYGYLFRPAMGSGSGARGSRDGRAVPGQNLSIKGTPKADLFAAGFGKR